MNTTPMPSKQPTIAAVAEPIELKELVCRAVDAGREQYEAALAARGDSGMCGDVSLVFQSQTHLRLISELMSAEIGRPDTEGPKGWVVRPHDFRPAVLVQSMDVQDAAIDAFAAALTEGGYTPRPHRRSIVD